MIITIDTDDIVITAKDGGKFVFDKTAEDKLEKLLEIKDKLDNVIEQVKSNLETNGLKLNPDFSGVRGDKIKVEYRAFGALYKLVDPKNASPDFYKTKTTYSLNTELVSAYAENHDGKLPDGIEKVKRQKKISISRLK
jgi:hypothetical protein|nr:MAG TPA: hypothetical protein [Caudoviricetes sp.]